MSQRFTYFVPLIIQHEGKMGFTARIVQLDSALNSEEVVWGMINSLTRDILGGEPEDTDELPVMPLGWTLISAQRGPAAKPERNGKRRKH